VNHDLSDHKEGTSNPDAAAYKSAAFKSDTATDGSAAASTPVGVYAVFAVLIPGLFLLGLDRLVRNTLDFFAQIPWWFILVALGCNIAVSVALSLLSLGRDRLASFLRTSFFIYAPAVGLLALFLYGTPQLLIYAGILLLFQWGLTHYIFRRFRDYVEFLGFVRKYRAASELAAGLRDAALLVHASYKNLKNLRKTVHILQFIIFSASTVLLTAGIRLQLFSLIACLSFIITALAFSMILGAYIDEYRFYIDGVDIDEGLKRRRRTYAVMIIVASLLLTAPLLRDSSLFPPDYIIGALNRLLVSLFSLFRFDFKRPPEPRLPEGAPPPPPPVPGYGTDGRYPDNPILVNLGLALEILGIIIAVLLVCGVLYFLFKPLLLKGFKNLLKGRHPLRALIFRLKQLLFFLRRTIHEFFAAVLALFAPANDRAGAGTPNDRTGFGAGAGQGRLLFRKRIQRNRALKAFMILIRWGTRHKIFFHPTLGPKEYIMLVMERLPQKREGLLFIAETFEEAVFSDHIIRPAVIRRYVHGIREIISGRAAGP
jgi:hypothetical protein